MVMETDEFEDYNGVEFRDVTDTHVMSVSDYGDLQSKAAHDALIQATQNLLPLADYIEQSFIPDTASNSGSEPINGFQEEG